MGVMDFLFGSPDQTEMDPQIKRARDFLLDQMLMQYSAGPVDVPQYMAMAPTARYSGSNALLSSLGLDTVAAPNMPTTTVGGMNVYTSQPMQEDMQTAYMNRYPAQFDYLRSFYMDPVTGEFGERSYGAANPIGAVVPRVVDNNDNPLIDVGSNSSYEGIDYTDGNYDNNTYVNPSTGNIVSVGYDVGQVDPGLAAAAGYSEPMNTTAHDSFGADLFSSLTDPSYDPPGTVVSRAFDSVTDTIGSWFD